MSRKSLVVVLALALLLLFSLPVLAATQNAVVYGTVYDASGNPLPAVTVMLDNPALGFSRTTTTGSDGSYNFAEVPPAEGYRITALKDGKKIDIRSGIVVNVGDERVIFPPLKQQAVTAAAQPVEKKMSESAAVQNETVSTAVSGVITGDQLRSLPLYNRNFLALGGLTPNVHDLGGGDRLLGASFSVNGQAGNSNNFLLDGADNVASGTNQAVPFQVNDSIQEFRVTSAVATAEYGRNMGGTVSVVTRRAGNSFHGNVFGYFGTDSLNSDSPISVYSNSGFAKAAAYAGPTTGNSPTLFPETYNQYAATALAMGGCTDGSVVGVPGGTTAACNPVFDSTAAMAANNSFKQPFQSKQFGVNLGGPIVKDKFFIFGSYEGTLIDNPNPIFERVPTAFDKTYNPLLGAGAANPQFLATDSNYVIGQDVLSLFPAANVTSASTPGIPAMFGFYRGQAPNYTNVHNFLARADWVPSENSTLSLRYALQKLNQLHDDSLPSASVSGTGYPGNGAIRDVLNQNVNLAFQHSMTAHLINDFHVGFNRFNRKETAQDAGFAASNLGLGTSSIPTFFLTGLDPQYAGTALNVPGTYGSWGNLAGTSMAPTLDSYFPFARIGAPLGAPYSGIDTTVFAADSLTWSHDKHNVKFGVEYRHIGNAITDGALARGYVFSGSIGEFTHDSETCNSSTATASNGSGNCNNNAFIRPSFDFAQQQPSPYTANLHSYAVSGYLQDTWRIHPRVTVNYGVRWDYFSSVNDTMNRLWNFDPKAYGIVQEGNTTTLDPFGNGCTLFPGWGGNTGAILTNGIQFGGLPQSWPCQATGFSRFTNPSNNNFAPRLGVAWDIFGDGKTVLRVGGGIYYDQQPVDSYAQLMYDRPNAANALYGTILNFETVNSTNTGSICPDVLPFSGYSLATCGLGNALLAPNGLTSTNLSGGVDPNLFYSGFGLPSAIYGRDYVHSGNPYSAQFNLSIQQQLSDHMAMEIGYVGSQASRLPVVYNANMGNEFNPSGGGTVQAGNMAMVPVWELANLGKSHYNSLSARLRVADWHGLRMNVAYTWSKSIDNVASSLFPVSGQAANTSLFTTLFANGNSISFCYLRNSCGAGLPFTFPVFDFSGGTVTTTGQGAVYTTPYGIPQDPFNWQVNDRGLSDFDARHRLVMDFVWDVPKFSKAFGWPTWMDNWMLSGTTTVQSGQPFTIYSGPILGEWTERVTTTGPVVVTDNPNGAISTTNIVPALANPACAFVWPNRPYLPAPNTPCIGTSGRNAFTGPGFGAINLAVQKGFHLFGEGKLLSFRAEFYNLTNRANYYNPVSVYSVQGFNLNPFFGKILSAHDPRQIQFGVRYAW